MPARLILLLLCAIVLGCARIYRPVALAQPRLLPRTTGLTGALTPSLGVTLRASAPRPSGWASRSPC
ncbi:MAG TPA: hypothetical protein VF768_06775 [Holophagaceae bacterium]